ncbi:MAG: ribosome small subunit-dependent GTPase A [Sporomusaceae bacterium]|nr:ribosome small subunit-dependent GTPase A [Sporomusaceae bacterium]
MKNINLAHYGLSPRFSQEATMYEGLHIARVAEQHRDLYKVIGEHGEYAAAVAGKLAHNAADGADFPAVGDWVMTDRADDSAGTAIIHHILTRSSLLARKAAGTAAATQLIAANLDTVFICMALNADFNLRRLERYLTVALDSMATPVIVLTKADLCDDLAARLAEVAAVSVGADVVVCSGIGGGGYREILPYIAEGKTIAFIGSSGVGKSTLINRLLGHERLVTREIRAADGHGRHTTTHRQLLPLPGGGIVIDTPGMRELQLDGGDLAKSFADIAALAAGCRYKDCSHRGEPGCEVRRAIEDGSLPEERFLSYEKLSREIGYEGLNSRQLEQEKIKRMFGSRSEMKQLMRTAKNKNKR